MADITKFPIKSQQRWRNRLGKRAVPCIVSERWIQFPERSDELSDGHYMFVDVMTMAHNGKRRKLCQLAISKEDIRKALAAVD